MRRILCAGALALTSLLFVNAPVQAQSCATGHCHGPAGLGIAPMFGWGTGGGSPFGCGGACMRLFGTWHQDGPLVNYGPYSGYYPFEPYGPWTSDLRYTGPRTRLNSGGGCNTCGGLLHRGGGCNTCGQYAFSTFRNVFSRLHPFARCQSAGCSQPGSCGSCAQ